MKHGIFVISLDFEMMWGNVESWTVDGYGKTNVSHVREVFDRMLPLFEKYGVKVTVGVVGKLMENDGNSDIKAENRYLYFAPDVIEKLKQCACVELGSHSYCHFCCNEKEHDKEGFEADIRKAVDTAENHGVTPRSFLFPRNIICDDYLDICAKYGFTSYRGNASKYFSPVKTKFGNYRQRLCRLIDSYINLGGNTSYTLHRGTGPLLNIPASRFLRPYNPRLALLEPLKLKRIKREMHYASQHGEVYHLWWHPHNMGAHIEKNLALLEKILQTYSDCHERYGMQSMTMSEIAENFND